MLRAKSYISKVWSADICAPLATVVLFPLFWYQMLGFDHVAFVGSFSLSLPILILMILMFSTVEALAWSTLGNRLRERLNPKGKPSLLIKWIGSTTVIIGMSLVLMLLAFGYNVGPNDIGVGVKTGLLILVYSMFALIGIKHVLLILLAIKLFFHREQLPKSYFNLGIFLVIYSVLILSITKANFSVVPMTLIMMTMIYQVYEDRRERRAPTAGAI